MGQDEHTLERVLALELALQRMQAVVKKAPMLLTEPATHADWTNKALSTTGKTALDLRALFGAPLDARAVLVAVSARDSGSAGADCWFMLSPNNVAGSGLTVRCAGIANDFWTNAELTVPAGPDGAIYYQALASGVGTLDVTLRVWGFLF